MRVLARACFGRMIRQPGYVLPVRDAFIGHSGQPTLRLKRDRVAVTLDFGSHTT